MKITMLGTSGSGKTTYMATMGALFYHGSVNGYTISCRESDYRTNARTFAQFEEIGTLFDHEGFPDGTAMTTAMNLELKYRGEHVIDIDWIDYRGGAVDDLARGRLDVEENAKLLATLYASDVIFVFIDSVALKSTKNIHIARNQVGANAINQILRQTSKNYKNVIFILSKSDSDHINVEHDYAELRDQVKELYEVFLSNTRTDITQYTIIPVGAVGIGNVKTTQTIQEEGRGGIKTFRHNIVSMEDIKPFNVASSFAHALLKCVNMQVDELREDVKFRNKKIQELSDKFRGVKVFLDILFHGSERRAQIRDLQEINTEKVNDIFELLPHKERLQEIINRKL